VVVQEVRWVEGGNQQTIIHFAGDANHHLGTGFFTHKGIWNQEDIIY
jgi:hypothetical protein